MSERLHDYHNRGQVRVLQALVLLAGHEAFGLSVGEVAKGLGVNASLAVRDLWNLEHAGMAEKLANGKWRLGPKPVQIALAFERGLSDLKAKADEITNRFTREPK